MRKVACELRGLEQKTPRQLCRTYIHSYTMVHIACRAATVWKMPSIMDCLDSGGTHGHQFCGLEDILQVPMDHDGCIEVLVVTQLCGLALTRGMGGTCQHLEVSLMLANATKRTCATGTSILLEPTPPKRGEKGRSLKAS